ncbi:neuronal growth regulator 1 isoform X3 [Dermochelys coriacea]|uniref:neuronal growth regulator 1 isoform X3 n=1 Tax=Dermochelys coriacea TaxID=27794 RepID=UPI001CA9B61F|nr:neuronal growth regulator 1 isoform X3 [Dermochelys coriacea]
MDMMLLVQGACCSNQWLAAVLLSLCCLLPSCLPAGQSMDFPGAAVDNLVVRKGDTAVLRCYLEDGASKGAWLNRSSIIFAGGDKWSVDPRVSIATANKREYSLQIQDVDVTDDGPYTCSVQTQHTPRTMQVHLTVQVSPKISRISTDIVVNEGSNVTLTCLASGKPEPSISWRHISPSAKPFENGQYLDIYGITRDQAGEYECSAENDVSVPDVKKVKVTVNSETLSAGASSTPGQRLSQIRRWGKKTREDMVNVLMHTSESDKTELRIWRITLTENLDLDRRASREQERARQEEMLRIMKEQSDMLRHLVEVQERQLDARVPL